MYDYPLILVNPSDEVFHLCETEKFLFKETLELIEIEKYSYSLFAIWNACIINIQRRIEEFGIDIFLKVFEDEKENFNKDANTLKDRWLNINEYKIVEYSRKVDIISRVANDLITMIYWMKVNIGESKNDICDKKEICSILYLLEKNLFLKEFKHNRRTRKDPNKSNLNRRKEDKTICTKLNNEKLLSKYDDLALKNKLDSFRKGLIKEEEQERIILSNKYG